MSKILLDAQWKIDLLSFIDARQIVTKGINWEFSSLTSNWDSIKFILCFKIYFRIVVGGVQGEGFLVWDKGKLSNAGVARPETLNSLCHFSTKTNHHLANLTLC